MKAAVLYKAGESLKVENDIEIPNLNRGQVLVKIIYTGLCHSQLMEVEGNRGEDKYLPHLLGHEATGIVMETGKEVTKVKKGDFVVLSWIKGSGIDSGGVQYRKGNKIINAGCIATFSEFSVVSENRCVILPKKVPLDVAVLFGCAIPTGAGIVLNEVKPKKGSSIAIFGLGGIGLSALIATKLFECSKVIVVDVEDEKLELSKEFGATYLINSRRENSVKKIKKITNDIGVDYSIEAAGLVSTIEQAFEVVKYNGGICIFASHPKDGDKIKLNPHDLIKGKQIKGSWGGNCNPDRDIPLFVKLYLEGKLPLEKMVCNRYNLDDINLAFDDLKNRKIIRAIIEINKNFNN